MAETFYTTLGVGPEADGEAIRRAYRNRVTECHPDVSDDPGALERFKRVTTARDVLLDDVERARYDRLGHEVYVREHVATGVWAAGVADCRNGSPARAADGGANPVATDPERLAWLGENPRRNQPNGGRGPGPRDGQPWQRASRAYRRSTLDHGGERSTGERVAGGLRAMGPWLPIHVVLLLSAVATVWFTVQASRVVDLSATVLSAGVLGLGVVVCLSLFHVVTRVYT